MYPAVFRDELDIARAFTTLRPVNVPNANADANALARYGARGARNMAAFGFPLPPKRLFKIGVIALGVVFLGGLWMARAGLNPLKLCWSDARENDLAENDMHMEEMLSK